jgi:hypothetical protein
MRSNQKKPRGKLYNGTTGKAQMMSCTSLESEPAPRQSSKERRVTTSRTTDDGESSFALKGSS